VDCKKKKEPKKKKIIIVIFKELLDSKPKGTLQGSVFYCEDFFDLYNTLIQPEILRCAQNNKLKT